MDRLKPNETSSKGTSSEAISDYGLSYHSTANRFLHLYEAHFLTRDESGTVAPLRLFL